MVNQLVITTYNRKQQVEQLINSLKFDGEITVFNDGGEIPEVSCNLINYNRNHGKRYYYELVTKIFNYLKAKDFKYFWMLPDDVMVDENIFIETADIWERLKDPRKVCLSVGHSHNRHYQPCWTQFTPRVLGEVVLTGWNDLCFMAERDFLELLNYKIEEPYSGYDYRSSGVGRYISRTLFWNGWNMYHTDKSYVDFYANETRMHL